MQIFNEDKDQDRIGGIVDVVCFGEDTIMRGSHTVFDSGGAGNTMDAKNEPAI